jgi:hypothetical protein
MSDESDDSSDGEFADALWFEPGSDGPSSAQESVSPAAAAPAPADHDDASAGAGGDGQAKRKKAPALDMGAIDGHRPDEEEELLTPSNIQLAAADALEDAQREEAWLRQQQLALALKRRYASLRPLFRAVFCKFDFDAHGFIDGAVFEGLMHSLFGAGPDEAGDALVSWERFIGFVERAENVPATNDGWERMMEKLGMLDPQLPPPDPPGSCGGSCGSGIPHGLPPGVVAGEGDAAAAAAPGSGRLSLEPCEPVAGGGGGGGGGAGGSEAGSPAEWATAPDLHARHVEALARTSPRPAPGRSTRARVGLGRIVALHYRSSTLYHIR